MLEVFFALSAVYGILIGLLLSFLFCYLDKDRKNINFKYLILTYLGGCLACYLSSRLEWHFGSYFKEMSESNLFEVFIYALFGVAIFEEGLKLFFAFIFSKLNKVKSINNIMTYSVISSCGFITIENMIY